MNIWKKGWQKTVQAIKQHRVIFSVLLILQIVFFFALSFNALRYQVQILSYAEEISTLVQEANLNPEQLQAGIPPLQDALPLYAAYQALQDTLLMLLWTSLAIFLGFTSILWVGAHQLLQPLPWSKKSLLHGGSRWVKSLLLASVFLGLFLGSQFFLFRESLSPTPRIPMALVYVPLVLYYFYLVSFAFITLPGKELLKRTWLCSIQNVQKTFPAFLFLIALLLGTGYGTFLLVTAGKQPFFIILSGLLVLALLFISKLWWIAMLHEIVPANENEGLTKQI